MAELNPQGFQTTDDLIYPEQPLTEQQVAQQEGTLDLQGLPIEIAFKDIDKLPNEQYALVRKQGLGTSDSSIVVGVNPYKTVTELINEKARDYITEEEKAVGNELAVRKGVDLEPLIIKKTSKVLGSPIIKPKDMYKSKEFPYMSFNYDGVMVTTDKIKYIPVEIKVVTSRGEKHYNPMKAYYAEEFGFNNIPENYSKSNNSIQTKAAQYGIPPYYYTQLQQQIYGLNAPYGYLSVLFEKSWNLHTFFVWRDDHCISDIIVNGSKIWQRIEAKREAE